MRRLLLAAAPLLALLLAGCASPQAELEDAVADLTDAANARSAEEVLDDANTVISLAEAQRDRLGDPGADRIVGLARVLGERSELLEAVPTTPPPAPTTPAPAPTTEEPEPEPTEEPTPTPEPTEEPEPTEPPEPTRPPATVVPEVPTPSVVVPTPAAAVRTQAPAAGLTDSGATLPPSPTVQGLA